MTDTDKVLASIDETLDGYVTWQGSDDAMEWTAERPSDDEVEEILMAELSPSPLAATLEMWMTSSGGAQFRLEAFQRVFLDSWERAWCSNIPLYQLPVRRVYVEASPPEPDPEPRWDDSLHASLRRTVDDPPGGSTERTVQPYRFGGLVPSLEDATRSAHELIRAMAGTPEQAGRAFGAVGKAFSVQADRIHVRIAPRLYAEEYRWHRRACRLCNPAGNPRPLRVNGAEYTRRTRAEKRRNRR